MSIFTKVKPTKQKGNVFPLSHEVKTTTNFGRLTPILCLDVLPGDKFRCNTECLIRLAPMDAPIMHRVNVYTHFFFVPNRILWDGWEDFITGGPDGKDDSIPPYFKFSGSGRDRQFLNSVIGPGTLADYLGMNFVLPTKDDSVVRTYKFDLLPFAAYHRIYYDFYRDQNLDPDDQSLIGKALDSFSEGSNEVDSGNPTFPLLGLNYRAWEKDYFTSALPWPQRGEQMTVPFGGTLPVMWHPVDGARTVFRDDSGGEISTPDPANVYAAGQRSSSGFSAGQLYVGTTGDVTQTIDNSDNLYVNLQDGAAVTINDLRRAFAIQRWLEANARGGARYCEQLLMHFNVFPQDARLQRPEFLGGGKSPVIVSEVLQNSETSTTPQGTMAGHGISASRNHSFTYRAQEHGWIIGIMSIMPRSSYQQGLQRKFSRLDKFDYGWPELAHLGEQEILNKELYYDGLNGDGSTPLDDQVFGYTPRYAEYKWHPSTVHGDFKNSLDFWHLGRIFDSRPALNKDFITCNDPNLNRIFAVERTDVDHFWCEIYHDIRKISKLPKDGTPSII